MSPESWSCSTEFCATVGGLSRKDRASAKKSRNTPATHRTTPVIRPNRNFAMLLWTVAQTGERRSQKTESLLPSDFRGPGPLIATTSSRHRIIPFASLDSQILHVGGQTDGAVACLGRRLIRGVAEAILFAQLLLNPAVDCIDRLLLGDFEEGPAGLP